MALTHISTYKAYVCVWLGDGARASNPIVLSIIKMCVCICWFSEWGVYYHHHDTRAPTDQPRNTNADMLAICCTDFRLRIKAGATSHGSNNNNYNNRRMLLLTLFAADAAIYERPREAVYNLNATVKIFGVWHANHHIYIHAKILNEMWKKNHKNHLSLCRNVNK